MAYNVSLMQIRTGVLRDKREARGWSQEQFAHLAGVSRATVQFAERGQAKRHTTIKKLADALGCQVSDLAEPANDEAGVA